nr:Periplasmic serine endoprotease DegP [Candidatus Anoxychlamydiales bacterium]
MTRIATFLLITTSILFSSSIEATPINNTYLQETSKAFSEVGKKAIPAVVFIKAEYNGTKHRSSKSRDPFDDEFFRGFFGSPKGINKQPQIAAGSGCLVSKDGYILTNNHIIKDAENINVTLNSGEDFEAKVIGTDPKTDLAIIKIEANNLPFLEFSNSSDIEIGEWVVAIGAPFQLQASLTVGVVSAKGRQNLRITDLEDFIQTDAAINPGNSGGPLLDLNARIVGINTAIVSQTGGYMGIGFAIPSNMAKHIMEQIINNGSVKRGHLGIYLQHIDKEMAEALDLKSTDGVLIAEITKKSSAEQAGLIQGDIIIAYNDIPIKNMQSFRNEIALMTPGDKVKLTVIRDGKKKNFTVSLGDSPDSHITSNQSLELGIDVSEMKDIDHEIIKKWQYTDNLEGVMITSVKYNSIAERAGLKPGMIIMQINHKKTKNISDFNES